MLSFAIQNCGVQLKCIWWEKPKISHSVMYINQINNTPVAKFKKIAQLRNIGGLSFIKLINPLIIFSIFPIIKMQTLFKRL